MKIRWYGHSCFQLTNDAGVRIITDPCDPSTGYKLEGLQADILTISHGHHDHNYIQAVTGNPQIIDKAGTYDAFDVRITGIPSFHDDVMGKKRGTNIIFKFETDNLSIVHAGDLGFFDEHLVKAIGKTDVLLVPIGGIFTIDAKQARELANCLKARVVIPMHYKTPLLTFELAELTEFIKNAKDCSIHDLKQSEATVSAEYLGTDRILILSPEQ